MARGAGAGRGRAPLRPLDARRGRETHRSPIPAGRDHRRDGARAPRPEAVRRPQAHGDRVVVGADGEEPQPGVRRRGRTAGIDVHVVDEAGQGGVRRTGGRRAGIPARGQSRQASRRRFRQGRDEAGSEGDLPLPDVRLADFTGDYIKGRGPGRADGRLRLLAIVAEGDRGRVYLAPAVEHNGDGLECGSDLAAGGRCSGTSDRRYLRAIRIVHLGRSSSPRASSSP